MNVAVSCLQSPVAAREELYDRFASRLVTNRQLDRKLVSFQGNRKLPFYRWLKYKEGYSADFVRYIIEELGVKPGVLLDPFAGTGATLFVGRAMGWDTIGIELLPVGFFAMEGRLAAETVDPAAFKRAVAKAQAVDWEARYDPAFALSHVPITRRAFPDPTERAIAGYRAYCSGIRDARVKKLFELAALAVLESVSYTRKDGQYLRWDHRCKRDRLKSHFDKGRIEPFRPAVLAKLREIERDLSAGGREHDGLFTAGGEPRIGSVDLRRGSCLDLLPGLPNRSVDFVITSPPYCNRYDYTRTYALELVFLGADNDAINSLRQAMLSCTVENKTKVAALRNQYERGGRGDVFARVMEAFEGQDALQEILAILEGLGAEGELNNVNIPNLVRNYFLEMSFVLYELSRILRKRGKIVMVNDNVRYAGEEIPVDLILSDLSERFGLRASHIWKLPRGKGNSSQQMGNHGRSELRKCVYVWDKP